MIYSALTDTELRRAVDNAPECLPALQEAARRWCAKTNDESDEEGYSRGYHDGKIDGFDEGYKEAYDAYADQ